MAAALGFWNGARQAPADFFRAFETLNIDLRHRERQPRSSDSDVIKPKSLHARSSDDFTVTSTAIAVADTADTAALAYGGMTFATDESLAGCSCTSPKQTCHIDFAVLPTTSVLFLDRFPRMPSRIPTHHVPCAVLYLVAMLV